MESWQISHITENLTSLLESTVCNELLLSIMSEKNVLSDCDLETLASKNINRYEKTKLLYDILKSRSNSYTILQDALLKTKQTGAFNILNQCNAKNIRTCFRCHKRISYNKDDLIGRGCYNTKVYSGKVSGRNVAVKIISCDDEQDAEKVLQEIKLLILLDCHDNIVKFFDAEIKEDVVLVALERCTASLDEFMNKNGTNFGIKKFDRWNILLQTALGVEHLHNHNVVHGDLKPSNILLLVISATEVKVKISDFGISKQLPVNKTRLTVRSSEMGTEGWMAPELLTMFPPKVSLASDIFSLGCIYYAVLTNGDHPFGDENHRKANVVDGKSCINQDLLKANNNAKPFVAQLIEGMTSRNPSKRPKIRHVLAFKSGTTKQISDVNVSKSTKVKTWKWSPLAAILFICILVLGIFSGIYQNYISWEALLGIDCSALHSEAEHGCTSRMPWFAQFTLPNNTANQHHALEQGAAAERDIKDIQNILTLHQPPESQSEELLDNRDIVQHVYLPVDSEGFSDKSSENHKSQSDESPGSNDKPHEELPGNHELASAELPVIPIQPPPEAPVHTEQVTDIDQPTERKKKPKFKKVLEREYKRILRKL